MNLGIPLKASVGTGWFIGAIPFLISCLSHPASNNTMGSIVRSLEYGKLFKVAGGHETPPERILTIRVPNQHVWLYGRFLFWTLVPLKDSPFEGDATRSVDVTFGCSAHLGSYYHNHGYEWGNPSYHL